MKAFSPGQVKARAQASHDDDHNSCAADHNVRGFQLVSTLRILAAGVLIALVYFGGLGEAFARHYWVNPLGLTGVLICGWPILRAAWRSISSKRMSMELSMTIAIVAALSVTETVTALIIVFFVLVAEEIEKLTLERGRHSLRSLLDLLPRIAEVATAGGSEKIPVDALTPGTAVIARPGSRIVVDGVVVDGRSHVDESTITGESMPVEKVTGSRVYAGTVNQTGALIIKTESVGADTAFGKIVAAVETADRARAQAQKTADKLAAYLVYFAVAAAAVTFFVTWDIKQTISVIIVTGACGIAAGTPLAVLGAIGRAASKGTVIKGGIFLEQLSVVDTIVLDKTGTITIGEPTVVGVSPAYGVTPEEVLSLAASAEALSEHPLGRAIVRRAKDDGITLAPARKFASLTGRGIIARVGDDEVIVGNQALMREKGLVYGFGPNVAATTEIAVAKNGKLIGRIQVADGLRPEAKDAIARLQGMGMRVIMLSGDSPAMAGAVAREVGITEFAGGLRPEDKAARVKGLKAEGRLVAMVGDGVNDAPALVEANVGVAVASGTDVAIESADVVLTGSNLLKFADTLVVARQWRRVVAVNFIGTVAIDALGIALAFAGMLTPLAAAFIHIGSEVIFLANSARLLPFFDRHGQSRNS